MDRPDLTRYLLEKKGTAAAFAASTLLLAVVAPMKSYILQWLLEAGTMRQAIACLALGVGITVLSHGAESVSRLTYLRMANHSVQRIREQVAQALVRQPMCRQAEANDGERLSLLTNDVRSIYDNYYMPLFEIAMWGSMGLAAVVMMASIDFWIMAMAVLMSLVPLTVPKAMSCMLARYRSEFSASDAAYTSRVGELLRGFETLVLGNAKPWFVRWQQEATADHAQKDYALRARLSLVQVMMSFISWLPSLLVLFVGVVLVFQERIALGSLITANALIAFVLQPMRSVSSAYASLKSALPIKKKLEDAMALPAQEDGVQIGPIREGVTLKIESFAYPGSSRPALTQVSLALEPGQKAAVVGESGSGKSTLARLLLKYYDTYSGSIRVDGRELRTIDAGSYYRRVAVIPQKCVVFSGTIRENICLGRPCTEQQLEQALRQAGLKTLVDSLPQGVDTPLREEGKNLSGGQSQRISIARALLQPCDLMLVDEATSGLDTRTTQEIMESLLDLPCAMLVITHDIFGDYMRRFDTICYMEDGQIRERGAFDALMAQNAGFACLYEKQL